MPWPGSSGWRAARSRSARRFIAAWVGAPDQGELLQDLWKQDTEPEPVEGWKILLDAANPNDDRVWLGRARRAILTGQLEEAATWLERCRARRPDDPAVWDTSLARLVGWSQWLYWPTLV